MEADLIYNQFRIGGDQNFSGTDSNANGYQNSTILYHIG